MQEKMQRYGIIYINGKLAAVANPQHANYPGYVFGTHQRHLDGASAIEEYRKHIRDSRPEAVDAESAAAADLQRIPGLLNSLAILTGNYHNYDKINN